MKYTFTCESEDLVADISKLVEVGIAAFIKVREQDYKSAVLRAQEKSVEDFKEEIRGLDNRLDGIEARVKKTEDFCEVKKDTPPKK